MIDSTGASVDAGGATATLPDSLKAFKGPAAPLGPAIQKVSYTHDAMIDLIIANPAINQSEIAKTFGYSDSWVSIVFSSDSFKHRLAERKNELVDPAIRASIEERFEALVRRSFDLLMKKFEAPAAAIEDETLLRGLEIGAKALGYGAKHAQVQVNQQFVVQLPSKAESVEAWSKAHDPSLARQPRTLDASPVDRSEEARAPAQEPSSSIQTRALAPSAPAGPDPLQALLNEAVKRS